MGIRLAVRRRLALRSALSVIAIAALAAGFSGAVGAQQPSGKRPAFEVASIKLKKDCTAAAPSLSPGTFRLPCISVRAMIRLAYTFFSGPDLNMRPLEIVGGPNWIDSYEYVIDAKPGAQATAAEMMGPMLRSLLEERFQVRIHKEPRDTSVYLLTVSEPNPNLRPAKEGDCVAIDLFEESRRSSAPPDPQARRSAPKQCGASYGRPNPNGPGTALDVYGVTMATFAATISSYAQRAVIDKTGLSGQFNLHLEFVPLPPRGPALLNGQMIEPPADSSMESSANSIFTALKNQLGLKLTPGKAPVDVIVVDGVERPSEN